MICHHFPCFPFAMCCSESWPYSRPDLLDRKFLPHFVMFPLSHGSENHHWSLGGELTVITLSSLQASFIWERGKVWCKGCVAESQALGGPWGHHEGIDAICSSSAPVSHAVFCPAHCPWGSYGNLQRGLSTSPPAFGCYHYSFIPAVPPEAFIALSFPGGASGKEPVCQCRRQEGMFRSLGQEDPLEEEMAIRSNILAWKTPRKRSPGGLQSIGSQSVRYDWSNLAFPNVGIYKYIFYSQKWFVYLS